MFPKLMFLQWSQIAFGVLDYNTGSVLLWFGHLALGPLPPPALHSWRISGEVLWVGLSCLMYKPVPYIRPQIVPAQERGTELSCVDGFTHTVPNFRGLYRSLWKDRSPLLESPALNISQCCKQDKHLADMGVFVESRAALGNWELTLTKGHFTPLQTVSIEIYGS